MVGNSSLVWKYRWHHPRLPPTGGLNLPTQNYLFYVIPSFCVCASISHPSCLSVCRFRFPPPFPWPNLRDKSSQGHQQCTEMLLTKHNFRWGRTALETVRKFLSGTYWTCISGRPHREQCLLTAPDSFNQKGHVVVNSGLKKGSMCEWRC